MKESSVETREAVERPVAATMRRAALRNPGKWELEDGEAPEPGAGQIRVRLEGCGVCASGIPVWEGREWFEYPMPPGALGHEGWGVVDLLGDEAETSGLQVGDRVAFLADGSYTTHLCLPAEQALKLPAALRGQPFPAEPVGCAVNVFERSDIQPVSPTLIIGMGFLGCLLLQLVRDRGGNAVCISSRSFSREMAQRLGAKVTVPLGEAWKVREELEALGYESFERVIEATGAQAGLEVAGEMVGERGRLIIAGYHQDGLREINLQQWNWKGIDVINAHERAPERYTSGMKKGIELAASGAIYLNPLLTHRYPLGRINEAYRDLLERPEGFVKGWIDLSDEAVER